jgi:flagellar hook-length control protein FliK
MLTTLHGRVEMDPMRVPLAASISAGRDDRFEQVLQETVAADEAVTPEPVAERVDEEPEPTTDATDGSERQSEEPRDEQALGEGRTQAAEETTNPDGSAPVQAQQLVDDPHRGEPVRQETAGKGADSPRTSSARPSSEPLLVAFVQHAAQQPAAPVAAAAARAVGAVGAVGAASAATGPTRGVDGMQQRASESLRAQATVAGYRTSSAASAELLEQARDSVFKQILLQVTDGGGEMRVRLQPPEFGELDVRLVVENGNQLNLTIAAERADMTQLLQRHLDELKHSLQAAGLDVTGASVHTRGEGRHDGARDQRGQGSAFAGDTDEQTAATSTPRLGGYVSAEGLDFWA